MKKISNEELINRFQRGDEGAYNQLYNRFHQKLFNYIYYMIQNKRDAEDILQNVFVKVYRKKDLYNSKYGMFSTWIHTIARHDTLSFLRWGKIRQILNPSEQIREDMMIWNPKDESTTHSETQHNKWQDVLMALQSIPRIFRTVLILRDCQELSYEEISIIVGVKIGTVRSRLNRGRIQLQQLINN